MKSVVQVCALFSVSIVWLTMNGCVSRDEYDTCVRRNETQRQRIASLLAGQDRGSVLAEKFQQDYQLCRKEQQYLQEKINALAATLESKNTLLSQMAEQLGQVALPVELTSALAEWAGQSGGDLVSFDEKSGIVRLKSDLLFDKGSDTVKGEAQKQLEGLSGILRSPSAGGFDLQIVGHTDDVPLGAATRAKHYSNWHLSAHRAIAVEKVLAKTGLAETRMAVMGRGEFRPIAPNKPNKRGNPLNRRVEIYIVPAG